MKHACKRTIIPLLVLILVSTLTLTAFAVSWQDSGTFSGPNYNGKYKASLELNKKSGLVGLTVWDYSGVVFPDDGVSAIVTEHYTESNYGPVTVYLTAGNSSSYSWGIGPYMDKEYNYVECNYYYMSRDVTSHQLEVFNP